VFGHLSNSIYFMDYSIRDYLRVRRAWHLVVYPTNF